MVRLREADTVTVLGGVRTDLDELSEVPVLTGQPPRGRRFDHLVLVPYAQARERGFEAHQDGTPLSCLAIDTEVDGLAMETFLLHPEGYGGPSRIQSAEPAEPHA